MAVQTSLMGTGGIFGNPNRRKGNLPFPTNSTFPSGLPGMDGPISGAPSPYEQQPSGKPNTLRTIAGIIGDTLAQYTGGQPVFAMSRMQAEKDRRDAEAAQAQRQASIEDYRIKKGIDQEFPDARQPHYWESNNGSLMGLGPDGQPTEIYHDPTAKYVPDGLGGLLPVPGTGGEAPQRAQAKIVPQRPANMTDEQLIAQAHQAARDGANVEDIFRQLQAWGVNP